MVKFPRWVDHPEDGCTDEHARSVRRLRFMVFYAAIHATPGASISALADKCEIARAQLHEAIREGKFSAQMAAKVERACGRQFIRREWLCHPLEFEELV
jgi:hypothetical protein